MNFAVKIYLFIDREVMNKILKKHVLSCTNILFNAYSKICVLINPPTTKESSNYLHN